MADGHRHRVAESVLHGFGEELRRCLQVVGAEQDGVLVHPGYFFDFAHEAFLVVSLIVEPARFDEGVSRLARRIG